MITLHAYQCGCVSLSVDCYMLDLFKCGKSSGQHDYAAARLTAGEEYAVAKRISQIVQSCSTIAEAMKPATAGGRK